MKRATLTILIIFLSVSTQVLAVQLKSKSELRGIISDLKDDVENGASDVKNDFEDEATDLKDSASEDVSDIKNSVSDEASDLGEDATSALGFGYEPALGEFHSVVPTEGVVLGPVIGKVTDTTARILVEFAAAGQETIQLHSSDGTNFNSTVTVEAMRPAIFVFEGLQVDTLYSVGSANWSLSTPSSFRTLNNQAVPSTFAVFSCSDYRDYQGIADEANLFGDLAQRAENREIDYIFQIGDQVYADGAYEESMTLLQNITQDQWPQYEEQLREYFRSIYRETWLQPHVARVLANAPNLMILSDHEVVDNWGHLDGDSNPSEKSGFIGKQAERVYHEYQRQLWDDIDFNATDTSTSEFFTEIINEMGVFFMDYNAQESWDLNATQQENPFLGDEQWAGLREAFEPTNGAFANNSLVIIMSPVPVALFSRHVLDAAEFAAAFVDSDEPLERWRYNSTDELARFLTLLHDWKYGGSGNREIVMFSGDVHHSGYAAMYKGDDLFFQQIVTSGIVQDMLSPVAFDTSRAAMEVSGDITDEWKIETYDWTRNNAYAIFKTTEMDPPEYTVQLITSNQEDAVQEANIVQSTYSPK